MTDFKDKLSKESDRSTFLIISALLETKLKELLLAKLKSGTKLKEIGANNFNNCINLSFALDLITSYQKDMYHKFRHMRNDFAHKPDFLDLNNVSIESIYEGHELFGSDIDNYIENKARENNISNDFWTSRVKFEFVFLSEIETLSEKINELKS